MAKKNHINKRKTKPNRTRKANSKRGNNNGIIELKGDGQKGIAFKWNVNICSKAFIEFRTITFQHKTVRLKQLFIKKSPKQTNHMLEWTSGKATFHLQKRLKRTV